MLWIVLVRGKNEVMKCCCKVINVLWAPGFKDLIDPELAASDRITVYLHNPETCDILNNLFGETGFRPEPRNKVVFFSLGGLAIR